MATIELHFDGAAEGVPAGGEITGRAVLLNDSPWTVRWAQLVLCWKAENDKRSEVTEVCAVRLAEPGEQLPPRVERTFRLGAPCYPRTFKGRHVRIFWYFVGDVCAEKGKAVRNEFPLRIVPARAREDEEPPAPLPDGPPPPWGGTV